MLWHPLYTFTDGSATDSTVYGYVPGKKKLPRKFLVTVKGKRFQVPEDEVEFWLAKQEDDLVEESVKPSRKRGKAVLVTKPRKPAEIKPVEADGWLNSVVADANRRVAERVAEYRRAIEDDDEDILLLMMGL